MNDDSRQSAPDRGVIRDHRRQWRDCLYVYPVISRRAKGLSIGVNLNPDRRCTFACPYCQIDRRTPRGLHAVHMPTLQRELEAVLAETVSGSIWREGRFAPTPQGLRRINDVAFSGDGEPTCLSNFDEAVAIAADVKDRLGLGEMKIVLITNSSRLDSPQVLRALPILDAHNGEIWAKLDAGSEEYFQRVNRPGRGLHLEQIVANIAAIARGRPVVIQTLLLRLDGRGPDPAEIEAYCGRLRQVLQAGGLIKLIQLHTVARDPAEAAAAPLSDAELDALAETIRPGVPGVPVETYYGASIHPHLPRVQLQ